MGTVRSQAVATHVDGHGHVRMVDVGAKPETVRVAQAVARVECAPAAMQQMRSGSLSKGDAAAVARIAGLQAAKRAGELIPLAHPIGIDGAQVEVDVGDDAVHIVATVRTTGRTGVEMEALTAAAVAGLAVIDMIKSIDRAACVTDVHLVAKSGGASGDWRDEGDGLARVSTLPPAGVITVSDRCAAGVREDLSGPALQAALRRAGAADVASALVPDDADAIRRAVLDMVGQGRRIVLTTGGTGLGPRDVTPESVSALLDREVPGLAEAIRAAGAAQTPMASLSRGIAGVVGGALVVTLPGSASAVTDAVAYLGPLLPHIISQIDGGDHEADK